VSDKVYLGDSVYASFDGYAIWLTTENGLPSDPSNRICLEPEVFVALHRFVSSLKKEPEARKEPSE